MKLFKSFLLIGAVTILTSANHDWDEKVGSVAGDGAVEWNSDGSFDLTAMNIKMEVHSIKSTEGSIMNNNTYKALKADGNPEITFALSSPVKSIPSGAHVIAAKINLSIAGVTKAIDMSVTATAQAHGDITFEGSKTIKMTDYGIKPPVALFGTLKTGDDITIKFKTVFTINK
jgi:polyisoprenoid-binding protein YceI